MKFQAKELKFFKIYVFCNMRHTLLKDTENCLVTVLIFLLSSKTCEKLMLLCTEPPNIIYFHFFGLKIYLHLV